MPDSPCSAPGSPEPGSTEPAGFEPELHWMLPEEFQALDPGLDEAGRQAYGRELAERVLPGGGAAEREALAAWCRGIAAGTAAEGAVYAGFGLYRTDDGRVSTVALTARVRPMPSEDAESAAAAVERSLAGDPAVQVGRREAGCGPVVVAYSGSDGTPGGQAVVGAPLSFAHVDVHCPLPQASVLLVLSLSTPSLPELPWYVGKLTEILDTVEVVLPETAGAR